MSDLEEQLKATVVDAKAAMLTDSRRCLISFGRRSNAAGVF